MLTVENLVKIFAGDRGRLFAKSKSGTGPARAKEVRAVDDVSFEVQPGEMFTLLGPSGCGKTTTLRAVAGLEQPDSGEIRVGDRILFSGGRGRRVQLPTNQRRLGMVFQSYAIWPHMKVFDNAAFPLQVLPRKVRPSKADIRKKTMGALETMGLADLADRQATKLSGGQQQRLALARALVNEPELILLDEPLSNLDAKLRESLRFELKRFQRELGITSIYVTHDQIEALALSSRIAVMKDGKISQTGKPREIYEKPSNLFVAEFIGTSNFLPGTVSGPEGEYLAVTTDTGKLLARTQVQLPAGQAVILAIRPEGIEITTDPPSGSVPNERSGTVVTRSYLGESVDHIVRIGEREIKVRCRSNTSVPQGTTVTLTLPPDSLSVIPSGD